VRQSSPTGRVCGLAVYMLVREPELRSSEPSPAQHPNSLSHCTLSCSVAAQVKEGEIGLPPQQHIYLQQLSLFLLSTLLSSTYNSITKPTASEYTSMADERAPTPSSAMRSRASSIVFDNLDRSTPASLQTPMVMTPPPSTTPRETDEPDLEYTQTSTDHQLETKAIGPFKPYS
jgi:hypothetical protein